MCPMLQNEVGLLTDCPLCQGPDIKKLYSDCRVWVCQRCGMIFRNPLPTPQEVTRFYTEAFRPDNVSNNRTGMAGTTNVLASQYVAYLQAKVGVTGRKILEFGAGLGITCRVLREFGADVTAIEPFAWSDCRKNRHSNVSFDCRTPQALRVRCDYYARCD